MKITDALIDKVHKRVNEKIYKRYPSLDMAGLAEGHIKRWEVEYVLEAYNERLD